MNRINALRTGSRPLTADEEYLLKEGILIGMGMLDEVQGIGRTSLGGDQPEANLSKATKIMEILNERPVDKSMEQPSKDGDSIKQPQTSNKRSRGHQEDDEVEPQELNAKRNKLDHPASVNPGAATDNQPSNDSLPKTRPVVLSDSSVQTSLSNQEQILGVMDDLLYLLDYAPKDSGLYLDDRITETVHELCQLMVRTKQGSWGERDKHVTKSNMKWLSRVKPILDMRASSRGKRFQPRCYRVMDENLALLKDAVEKAENVN